MGLSTEPDDSGMRESLDALLGSIHEPGQARLLVQQVDPWTLASRVARSQPPELTTLSPGPHLAPEVRMLRAIALSYSLHEREECALQLYQSACELANVGHVEWAEVAVRHWNELVHAMALEFDDVARLGLELLERAPALADRPVTVALVATSVSASGNVATADRLWRRAVTAPLLTESLDQYWRVHLLWAAHHLIPRLGHLAHGMRLLRRGRNHFAAQGGDEALDQAHFASSNLAMTLFLVGDSAEACGQMERDSHLYSAAGIHQAFLQVLQAMAMADLGRTEPATQVLENAIGRLPANNLGVQLSAVAVAQLLLAHARRDVEALHEVIGRLLDKERSAAAYSEDRVLWRLVAARALDARGLQAAALSHVREAMDICRVVPCPYYRAWAALGLAALDEDEDARAAFAVEALDVLGTLDTDALLTSREPEWAICAMMFAASRDNTATFGGAIRRPLAVLGRRRVERLIASRNLTAVARSAGVQAMLSDLGWTAPPPDPHQAPALDVRLLGRLEIRQDGVDITASAEWKGRHKARLLLARLLVADGAFVHRDELIADLWGPHTDPDKGSASLRATVSVLRRVLEPHVKRNDGGSYIVTSGGSTTGSRYRARYRINMEHVYCDATDFLEAAGRCGECPDTDMALNECVRAIRAYGGPFLQSEVADGWIREWREKCHREFRATAVRLGHLLEASGQLADARAPLEALLVEEPSCQEACRLLMKLYASEGETALVSATYQRMIRHLDEELGLSPDYETSRLYGELLTGRASDPDVRM